VHVCSSERLSRLIPKSRTMFNKLLTGSYFTTDLDGSFAT
jgi:hypothetical protein